MRQYCLHRGALRVCARLIEAVSGVRDGVDACERLRLSLHFAIAHAAPDERMRVTCALLAAIAQHRVLQQAPMT